MSRNRPARAVLATLLTASLSVGLSTREAQGQTKIITGVVAHAATQLAEHLTASNGCATEFGIELDFCTTGAGGAQQLNAGGVDATILNPPASFRANGRGFTHLSEIADHMKGYPFTVLPVNTTWAEQNCNAVVAFTKSHFRGNAWLYRPENRAADIGMIIKHTKADPQNAEKSYDDLVTRLKAFSPDGLLTKAIFNSMKAGLIQMGDVQEPALSLCRFFDGADLAVAAEKRPDAK